MDLLLPVLEYWMWYTGGGGWGESFKCNYAAAADGGRKNHSNMRVNQVESIKLHDLKSGD